MGAEVVLLSSMGCIVVVLDWVVINEVIGVVL